MRKNCHLAQTLDAVSDRMETEFSNAAFSSSVKFIFLIDMAPLLPMHTGTEIARFSTPYSPVSLMLTGKISWVSFIIAETMRPAAAATPYAV